MTRNRSEHTNIQREKLNEEERKKQRTGCEEQPITEHGVMSEETPSLEQKKDDQLRGAVWTKQRRDYSTSVKKRTVIKARKPK